MLRLFLALFMFWGSSASAAQAPDVSISGGCSADRVSLLKPRSDLIASAVTYCDGGDTAKGTIALTVRADQLSKIDLFYSGYPNGKTVRIVATLPNGTMVYPITGRVGETWQRFAVDLPTGIDTTDKITISMVDDSGDLTGWGALAYAKATLGEFAAKNYLQFFLKCLGVGIIIFLPGLFMGLSRRVCLPSAFLPIPGIIVLTVSGVLFWWAPPVVATALRFFLYSFYLLIFVSVIWSAATKGLRSTKNQSRSDYLLPLGIFVLTFAQAASIGVNPLSIAQEFAAGSTIPGRMIASPPDHAIPYQSAVYMFNGYDGHEMSETYFGTWNISSRGPIAPLGINSLFHLFKSQVTDSLLTERSESWPIDRNGVDLSRIYGWFLNATVVLGAFYLASALGVSRRWRRIAVVWVAISPVVLINTVFLWPKLLAVYFVLLCLGLAINQRHGLAGFMIGLAWLSHPVGALMLPVVGLYAVLTLAVGERQFDTRLWIRKGTLFALALIACMTPWLAYKVWLGYPDVLFTYVVGGGQKVGLANSFAQWLTVRLSNFWLTISPGAFFYSDHMHSWLYGPIPDALKWAIQSAKTLPGAVGTGAYAVAVAALLHRPKNPATSMLRTLVLVIGLLVMLVFWGFSSDGLGRNSLEPISVTLMIYTVASGASSLRWLPPLLWLTAAESLYVLFAGFYLSHGFDFGLVKTDAAGLALLSVLIMLVLLKISMRRETTHQQSFIDDQPCADLDGAQFPASNASAIAACGTSFNIIR